MKKAIAALALMGLVATQSSTVAAQSAALAERAGSPASESEDLAGGAGIWAVILAIAVGIGIIILVEDEEDDLPESP